MKKLLATIVMITCILGLTACGKESEDNSKETYQQSAALCFAIVSQEMPEEAKEEVRAYTSYDWSTISDGFAANYGIFVDGETFLAGFESWWAAEEEIGGAVSMESDYTNYGVSVANGVTTVTIKIEGTDRNATAEVTFDEDMNITGIVTNATYSFGEKMVKAALNTLLGMGTVFIVLIFICLIISCFSLISKAQARAAKKSGTEIKQEAADHTIAQISEREEENLTDDMELVAVISAAIAASEGAVSTDGFIVRSIKRANRR